MRLNRATLMSLVSSVLGLSLFGSGLMMSAKSAVAPILLKSAWQASQGDRSPVRPWTSLDAYPKARLSVPALNIDQVILDRASGQALAFAPGFVSSGSELQAIAAHKNTHFGFLKHMTKGMKITLTSRDGLQSIYAVRETRIIDTSLEELRVDPETKELVLITCYPFDALSFRGPKRFIVIADPIRS